MTKLTGSSSSSSSNWERSRVAGIPTTCWCGHGIVEKISGSDANPYRRYYRCLYAYEKKLHDDPHVFKWVDEALVNEVTQLDYQVGVLEEELGELKKGRFTSNSEEVENMKTEIFESLEQSLFEAKRSMKKMVMLVFFGFLTVVVLAIVLKLL